MVCLGFEPTAAEWKAQTKPRSYGGRQLCGFYWGHQSSWTLSLVNSMQVSNMQYSNSNWKKPDLRQGLNLVAFTGVTNDH